MRVFYYYIFFFLFLAFSCKRKIYSDLGNTGPGEVYFVKNQGFNNHGIVVYKSVIPDEYGNYRYSAFDRTCTYEPDYSCVVDTTGDFSGLVECGCCKSQYLLMYEGSVFKGPAVCPLKQYICIIDGDRLIIRN